MAGVLETVAHFNRCEAQLAKVVARRQPQHLQPTRDVQQPPAAHLDDQRMAQIARQKYLVGDLILIPGVDLVDGQNGQQVVFGRTQRDVGVQPGCVISVDRQCDRHGEEMAVGEPHLVEHALVVSLAHEPIERRKPAGGEQLEIAHRAFRQLQAGQCRSVRLELVARLLGYQEIHELAAVRRNQGLDHR